MINLRRAIYFLHVTDVICFSSQVISIEAGNTCMHNNCDNKSLILRCDVYFIYFFSN